MFFHIGKSVIVVEMEIVFFLPVMSLSDWISIFFSFVDGNLHKLLKVFLNFAEFLKSSSYIIGSKYSKWFKLLHLKTLLTLFLLDKFSNFSRNFEQIKLWSWS